MWLHYQCRKCHINYIPVGTPDWVDVGSAVDVIKVGTVDRISIVEVDEKLVRSTQCISIQLL